MWAFFKPRKSSIRLLVLMLALAWPFCSYAADKQKVYDLPLPRAIGLGEALVARVSVGPLKAHQRIVVRVRNGQIAGTVAPFGAQARQGSGIYTIPIPENAPQNGEVRLLVEVEEKNAKTRAPTIDEVRGITLAYIAVTRSSKE